MQLQLRRGRDLYLGRRLHPRGGERRVEIQPDLWRSSVAAAAELAQLPRRGLRAASLILNPPLEGRLFVAGPLFWDEVFVRQKTFSKNGKTSGFPEDSSVKFFAKKTVVQSRLSRAFRLLLIRNSGRRLNHRGIFCSS